MRFIIDAELPPALAQRLSELGHAAQHVADVGLLGADDRSIWQYAREYDSVVITKDEDFSVHCLEREKHPAVVWLRIGNCSNQALLDWFLPIFPDILLQLREGEKLIEVV